jgi:hypothetical protein
MPPVLSLFNRQDTRNVKKLIPQSPEAIISQANTLLDDLPVNAFKIGLIGHHETAAAIHSILIQHPHIPVILDPVLAAGGGAGLSNDRLSNHRRLAAALHYRVNAEQRRSPQTGGIDRLERLRPGIAGKRLRLCADYRQP